MITNDEKKRLAAFRAFVENLFDIEDEDADWKNRLGWAWERLYVFAELMGPEYLEKFPVQFDAEYLECLRVSDSVPI